MVYLLLAIASSAMVSIVMRLSEGKTSGGTGMLAMNYLMCLMVSGACMGFGNMLPQASGFAMAAGMGAVNGLLYLLGFVLLRFNVKKNGVVLSATFMKLGLLVPMVVSVCFFHEMPTAMQAAGFCIALTAIVLINFEKEESAMSSRLGLLLLLLAGGGADAMSKLFEELGDQALSEQFLFYTFAAAFALCLALMCWKKERPDRWDVLFGLLIGIPNYFSARFLLRALESLPAVIVYPTYSVATIVVVTLAGVCFFRERLGKRQWIAVGAIVAALALLNL